VHLRAFGSPILADPVYGSGTRAAAAGAGLTRLALHAETIDVPHPSGRGRVRVSAPWPADLAAAEGWFNRSWSRTST
jgi:23S rRNA pseudouridine1911/1915/1917 synthase